MQCAEEGSASTVKASNLFGAVAPKTEHRSTDDFDLLSCSVFQLLEKIRSACSFDYRLALTFIIWFLHWSVFVGDRGNETKFLRRSQLRKSFRSIILDIAKREAIFILREAIVCQRRGPTFADSDAGARIGLQQPF